MGCLSSLLCFILTVWYLFWSLDHNLNNSIISSDAMIIIVPTLDELCATELVCKMFLGLNLWNLLIMVVISVVILFGMRLNYTQILCIFYSHILGMYCLQFLSAGSFNSTTDTVPPKKRILDTSQDFYTAGFVPGANIHFSYDLPEGTHHHND